MSLSISPSSWPYQVGWSCLRVCDQTAAYLPYYTKAKQSFLVQISTHLAVCPTKLRSQKAYVILPPWSLSLENKINEKERDLATYHPQFPQLVEKMLRCCLQELKEVLSEKGIQELIENHADSKTLPHLKSLTAGISLEELLQAHPLHLDRYLYFYLLDMAQSFVHKAFKEPETILHLARFLIDRDHGYSRALEHYTSLTLTQQPHEDVILSQIFPVETELSEEGESLSPKQQILRALALKWSQIFLPQGFEQIPQASLYFKEHLMEAFTKKILPRVLEKMVDSATNKQRLGYQLTQLFKKCNQALSSQEITITEKKNSIEGTGLFVKRLVHHLFPQTQKSLVVVPSLLAKNPEGLIEISLQESVGAYIDAVAGDLIASLEPKTIVTILASLLDEELEEILDKKPLQKMRYRQEDLTSEMELFFEKVVEHYWGQESVFFQSTKKHSFKVISLMKEKIREFYRQQREKAVKKFADNLIHKMDLDTSSSEKKTSLFFQVMSFQALHNGADYFHQPSPCFMPRPLKLNTSVKNSFRTNSVAPTDSFYTQTRYSPPQIVHIVVLKSISALLKSRIF